MKKRNVLALALTAGLVLGGSQAYAAGDNANGFDTKDEAIEAAKDDYSYTENSNVRVQEINGKFFYNVENNALETPEFEASLDNPKGVYTEEALEEAIATEEANLKIEGLDNIYEVRYTKDVNGVYYLYRALKEEAPEEEVKPDPVPAPNPVPVPKPHYPEINIPSDFVPSGKDTRPNTNVLPDKTPNDNVKPDPEKPSEKPEKPSDKPEKSSDKSQKPEDKKENEKAQVREAKKDYKKTNPKTGVAGMSTVASLAAVSLAGIVATRKKNN